MRTKGVRFTAAWGRQAFNIGGRFKFWGGLTVEAVGGGPGLVESLTAAARKNGIDLWYGARATGLLADDDGVKGVQVRRAGRTTFVEAKSVVLAAGGFQANPEWRARYLGPKWEHAKVRGTRFNAGDVIRMAVDIGAAPVGNWSGCHAVAWERNAPEFGDLAVGDQFQKHSYLRSNVGDLDCIYTMNEVSTTIWELLDGKTSIGRIVESVWSTYDVSPEEAERDTLHFLDSLKEAGLIHRSGE